MYLPEMSHSQESTSHRGPFQRTKLLGYILLCSSVDLLGRGQARSASSSIGCNREVEMEDKVRRAGSLMSLPLPQSRNEPISGSHQIASQTLGLLNRAFVGRSQLRHVIQGNNRDL
jgi:hypothetical protein